MPELTSGDMITLFGILFAGNGLVQYVVSILINRKEKESEDAKRTKKTLSLQSYYNLKRECHDMIEKGYATEVERRFLYKMYDNYKEWGWNGDMDAMIERVDRLPYLERDSVRR